MTNIFARTSRNKTAQTNRSLDLQAKDEIMNKFLDFFNDPRDRRCFDTGFLQYGYEYGRCGLR